MKIRQALNLMLSPTGAKLMSVLFVILLLTPVIILAAICHAGGQNYKRWQHDRTSKALIVIWGGFFTAMNVALLPAGGWRC